MDALSVLIITFNEEKNIQRAIESVLNVADEIIILDSYSTDKTMDICSQYKQVNFHQRKWSGYGASKNYLNSLAKHEFVLSLDADEALDAKLEKDILNHKSKGFKGVYEVNRMSNYCGKWIKFSGWYPDRKVRLFSRVLCRWDDALVHESLIIEGEKEAVSLTGHLLHYSYYSYAEHRQRADKYSLLTAQKLFNQGKRAHFLKPYLSAFFRFFSMYFIKLGFLDGYAGFKIAQISALSNIVKYKTLIKLTNQTLG